MSKSAAPKYEKPVFEDLPIYAPKSQRQHNFMWSDADITVFGGAAGCLDASGEFLTPQGWKSFSEYTEGDLVAQYDKETNKLEFVKPDQYIKLPCDNFKRVRARGIDFILSDEHKVPYWESKKSSEVKIKTWGEIVKGLEKNRKSFRGWIKTTFDYSGEGLDLSEGELRLQIAVQADGRIVKEGKDNYTQMRMSKKRKYERLKWILDTWGLRYKDNGSSYNPKYENDTEYEIIVFPKYADKVFDSKYYNATADQLKIIKDEVGYWDGTIYDSGVIRYSTVVKENADFVQFVFHACGNGTSYHVDERKGKYTNGSCYQVDCNVKIGAYRTLGETNPVEDFKSTDGFKYCFTMPKCLFLARQSGNVFITHNSGKTWVGISKFVRFIDEPEYIGYIIRKTASSLRTGAFETAKKIFKAACPEVKINSNEMSFRFPSGCRIYMKGLDGQQGIDFFQGQEISGVLIDEATHLNAEEVSWILTRLRTNSNAKPVAWMSCNPDNSSWLLDWVDWYLHPKKTYVTEGDVTYDIGGRPDQAKNEMLRWFYVINGLYVWDTDRDRLVETYKDVVEKEQFPMSFRFIGATYKDNPMIDRKYVSDLLNKSRIEKERLVFGSWYARPEGAGFWSNEWCKKIKTFPHDEDPDDEIVKRVRCWDLAYTEPHEGNLDPDYTVGVLMAQTKKGYYIVEHVVRAQMKVGKLYRYIADVALKDCDMYGVIPQILPEDPASGKATFAFAREYLMSSGVPAVSKVSGSNQRNKVERFKNFAAASENGAVYIMEADWNDVYFTELEAFDGTRNVRHDDGTHHKIPSRQ